MKKKVIVGLVVLALCAAGAALAAWILTSSGTAGRGAVGSITAPTVSQAADSTGTACLPGQLCSMKVKVNNPNSSPLTLTAVSYGSLQTHFQKTFGTDDSTCPIMNGAVHNLTGLSIAIPPGSSTITVPGVYTLDANAPTACMGDFVVLDDAGHDPATYTWSS